MGIWAARLIYAGIGTEVRRMGHDSITHRARTTRGQKIGWMTQAALRASLESVMPQSAVKFAPPLPEVAFLVQAAGRAAPHVGRTGALLDVLAELRARERTLGTGAQGA
jgi:15-cis-phytoene synthase